MSDRNKTFGKNIKKYRKMKGITLKELGTKVGISEATMQKYEAGNIKNVSTEMLKKVSNALGVDPIHLMDWEVDEDFDNLYKKTPSEKEEEFLALFRQLPESIQFNILNMMKEIHKEL